MKKGTGPGPAFVPGMELAEQFFQQAVAPILRRHAPDLAYSAGLIGPGSEVLGFDDEMSTDHHWGPRAMLFLPGPVIEERGTELRAVLGEQLPKTILGYPTGWSEPDPDDNGVQHLETHHAGPIRHRVEIFSLPAYLESYLGLDLQSPLSPADWLTLPWQKLRSLSAGKWFRDDLGLAAAGDRLRWYPQDVWLYVLASGWARIGQEEHVMGRAGSTGDEAGSAIIASRLARDIMRMAFLMERVYPPYPKWFGRAFTGLACAPVLHPLLEDILHASSWRARDAGLGAAYEHLADMHNALELTSPMPRDPSTFWGRPFTVIWGDRFAEALRTEIRDPAVANIAKKRLIGTIDLVTDNTDLLEDSSRRKELLHLYA